MHKVTCGPQILAGADLSSEMIDCIRTADVVSMFHFLSSVCLFDVKTISQSVYVFDFVSVYLCLNVFSDERVTHVLPAPRLPRLHISSFIALFIFVLIVLWTLVQSC